MPFGPWLWKTPNSNNVAFGTAPPSAATDTHPPDGWRAGDFIINTTPGPGGPFLWFCSAAGTPGSWNPFPSHSAARTTTTASGIQLTDGYVIVDSTAGTLAEALPSVSAAAGKSYTITRNGAANAVTITAAGLIYPALGTISLNSDGAAVTVYSDGTKWRIQNTYGTVAVS